jgi:aspartate-semialdehyde dehydrogenase
MLSLGIVGWRGMVGTVLLHRMIEEGDFDNCSVNFYSTSQVGQIGPNLPDRNQQVLLDAYSLEDLRVNDVIITAQGGDYTSKVYKNLRDSGWKGLWIDAASALRMNDESCIVLDPVNADVIQRALDQGIKTFVGGNCTVSLLLMALAPVFKSDLVEWVSSMTYQAASGAGARQMDELLEQGEFCSQRLALNFSTLESELLVREAMQDAELPTSALGAPLAYSVLPFIDTLLDNGQSREEWKGEVELNKILALTDKILVDGVCVRVPVLRSHSQGFLLKLKRDVALEEVESLLDGWHEWIDLVPNNKADTLKRLTPCAVSGSLKIAVGRLRHARFGANYVTGFTVGDQLLWGAAEPLRRMWRILKLKQAV